MLLKFESSNYSWCENFYFLMCSWLMARLLAVWVLYISGKYVTSFNSLNLCSALMR